MYLARPLIENMKAYLRHDSPLQRYLRLALYSLIESIRNEPVKYSSLIYNNNVSLPGTTHYPASFMYGGQQQQQQYISSQDYFTEHYIAMLIQVVMHLTVFLH
jgi:hypothetical protein